MRPRRNPEAGFTLIETLVALAVLSVTAVGLLAATQGHIRRIVGLEQRTAAMWAAENHLAEFTLGLQPQQTPAAMLGFAFVLNHTAQPTSDPAVQRVVIAASRASDGQQVARLTGFVLTERLAALP